MFWNRKPKSPITAEDESWVIAACNWVEEAFGIDVSTQVIYLPTKEFLGFNYTGSEADALQVVNVVAGKMGIEAATIEVYFFDEFQPLEFTDEGVHANYGDGTQLAEGIYSKVIDGVYEIGIEISLLKTPKKLIATVAHELAHIKLLGEERLEENDEHLTDLTASLFGFIVFLTNASIGKMTTWSGNSHSGWKVGGWSGYIHYKVYAFLIAYLLIKRNEKEPEWLQYIDSEIRGEVKKSLKYLESKE